MTHYVCPGGCEGMSHTPAVCQSETCSLKDHQMVACNCEDGQHTEVMAQASEPSDTADSAA